MHGLTTEQRQRLSLITSLDDFQAKLILAGLTGILDNYLKRNIALYTKEEVAQELLDDIDTMIAKAYEKGMYS